MSESRTRICDDCPEHLKVKEIQARRDLEQKDQWGKISEALAASHSKVGPAFVILALGIVLTVCAIGFKVIYEQNTTIAEKVDRIKDRVIALETKLEQHDKYDAWKKK